MMAKAVATESQMNFISVKGPELFSKYVGESEKQVREVFRKARQAAPCVVFFDEIDSMAGNREQDAGGVGARVLSQLLNEMDGIDGVSKQAHLIVMAATNRPEALDPAIMRPGRFDRLLHVPLPDYAAREAILRAQFKKMRCGFDARKNPDFLAHAGDQKPKEFVEEIAEKTEGYSGAETVNLCKEAALAAIQTAVASGNAHGCELEEKHILEALRTTQPRTTPQAVAFYKNFETKGLNA